MTNSSWQKRAIQIINLSLITILLSLSSIIGQTFEARLVGKVTDQNSAPIPGVTVTVTNIGTNQKYIATTNDDGDYTLVNLQPKIYKIEVEVQGFKKAIKEQIKLDVGDVQRIDFSLETGQISETVNVYSDPPLINTETGTKGQVITNKEIVELPLNGRDFSELAFLTPGVVEIPEGLPNGGFAAVNGGRGDNVNFQIDGLNNRSNRAGNAVVSPSVDAVSEFKVQTSAYSAEFGQVGSGAINIALKSGSNKVSGSLYEFYRDDMFDARSFFAPNKEKLTRHQYGGTIGGPLPFFNFGEGGPSFTSGKNKTFFFISFEGKKEERGQVAQSRTITEREKAGDFSESFDRNGCNASAVIRAQIGQTCTPLNLVNPFSANAAIASRIIPDSIKNAIGQRVINLFPNPNQSGVTNYVGVGNGTNDDTAYIFKVDHNFSSKAQMGINYLRNNTGGTFPYSQSSAYPGFGGYNANRNDQIGGRLNYNFSSNFIYEARVAYNYTDNQSQANTSLNGSDEKTQLAKLLSGTLDPAYFGFPRTVIRGLSNFGDNSSEPVNFKVQSLQLYNAVSIVKGSHFIRTGVDYIRTIHLGNQANNSRGTINFTNGTATNYPIADALIGIPNQTNRFVSQRTNEVNSATLGIFVQDDYRIRPSITLNFGLRYDYFSPPFETDDLFSAFLPSLGRVAVASVAAGFNPADPRTILANDAGLSRSLVNSDKNNFSPRFGFAWRMDGEGKTVVRGGYGLFYADAVLNAARSNFGNNFPISFSQTFNRVTTNLASLTLNNPYPNNTVFVEGTIQGVDGNAPSAYNQQFNLTFERQLFAGIAAEISYVGSRGKHFSQRYDVNAQRYVRDANGNIVTTLVGTTVTAQTVRPYSLFSTTSIQYISFGASSNYNSVQATLRRNFKKGYSFRINYVFSKAIDDASALTPNGGQGSGNGSEAIDPDNLKLEKGLSGFNREQTLTFDFNYQIPIGKGRAFLNKGGLTEVLLGGWQLTGLGRLLTGQPFSVGESAQTFNLGESIRPDRICDGRLANPTVEKWYDNACFVSVPTFNVNATRQDRRGTSGRNVLIGPGRKQFDISLQKYFNLTETKRLQFRWELFNVMNIANFRLPVRQIDAINVGRITSSENGREMQFGLKFLF